MAQISLTASMRSNLLSLQGTADLMAQTQERLATGKKVNSAIDNPSSYYTAQSLNNRANDLSSLLDSMGQAVSTIKAANEGIESITSFVEQARAVASSAVDTTDGEAKKKYMAEFNAIRSQINAMAEDSGYKGINLLKDQDLTVKFSDKAGSTLTIEGVDATSGNRVGDVITGLGIREAADWETDATKITQAIDDATDAISTLRTYASTFGNNYSIVQTREEFTNSLVNVLEEGADKLTLADMNEESANMLALQTRQQLAINSLSLASQAAQSVLQLFQ
ncbi:MAG: flagellin [Alphaproteobacteria bacterium]|nr:flagellin [Alphaproteobacteria bacterium]